MEDRIMPVLEEAPHLESNGEISISFDCTLAGGIFDLTLSTDKMDKNDSENLEKESYPGRQENTVSDKEYKRDEEVENESEIKIICDVCFAKLGRSSALEAHKIIHRDKKNIQCSICNKLFGNNGALKNHITFKHK